MLRVSIKNFKVNDIPVVFQTVLIQESPNKICRPSSK